MPGMNPIDSALLTDLYQLTMLQTYFERGMRETAVFELFVRRLPPQRNFLIAAGLEQALDYLENLHFADDELRWLAECGHFGRGFIDELAALRFTGDVDAMPEGTVFFPEEPILRIVAPLPEAQFVETRLVNLLNFQTMIASKAARCVLAAPGRLLVDFGLRRAHGAEAGLLAARAAAIAGFAGTSVVLAGPRFGIPLYGTMAHSYVQAHDDEVAAFADFARTQSGPIVLLIDTYDTEAAAAKVARLAMRLRREGLRVDGVRLDSGDLADHARKVRRILDDAGHPEITIFASGNLDEWRLRALVSGGAPIDGFGVGTELVTSADYPSLDCAYKLQEYAGAARRKRSEGKATWPGRKQVYRLRGDGRGPAHDVLTLCEDAHAGEALLRPAMRAARRLAPRASIALMQARTAAGLAALPGRLRALEKAEPYEVRVADGLRHLAAEIDARTAAATAKDLAD
ncbi:MAG: Nicotinate phosphoribosyltransferase pncB2 [Gammaproteobacteria bacterium]|nr:Nicotinate phosphoribosyltransferase pncB2 [Gammaproteobacteria bacterium]